MIKMSDAEINEIFNPNRINDNITLNKEEINYFLKNYRDEEFVIFEKPVHVRIVYWAARIGSNLCIVIKDKNNAGMYYIFAMQSDRIKDNTEILKLKDKIDNKFSFFLGAGYEEGVDYIE